MKRKKLIFTLLSSVAIATPLIVVACNNNNSSSDTQALVDIEAQTLASNKYQLNSKSLTILEFKTQFEASSDKTTFLSTNLSGFSDKISTFLITAGTVSIASDSSLDLTLEVSNASKTHKASAVINVSNFKVSTTETDYQKLIDDVASQISGATYVIKDTSMTTSNFVSLFNEAAEKATFLTNNLNNFQSNLAGFEISSSQAAIDSTAHTVVVALVIKNSFSIDGSSKTLTADASITISGFNKDRSVNQFGGKFKTTIFL